MRNRNFWPALLGYRFLVVLLGAVLLWVVYPELGFARTFRIISLENASINPDRSLLDNGVTYPEVETGVPAAPQIAYWDAYRGSYSLLYQVDDHTTTQRIEHKLSTYTDPDALNFTNFRYISFALKLDGNTPGFDNSAIFAQLWQGYPLSPPLALKFFRDRNGPNYTVRLAVRNMDTGSSANTAEITVWQGEILADQWQSFILFVRPRYNSNGEIKLWLNGRRVTHWFGKIGYNPNELSGVYNGFDVKFGLYQPGRNLAHRLFFDQIKFTTTYAEANPDY